jgi:acyl-CoA synthetase (AMP-forming)/AMP-acid ligase II
VSLGIRTAPATVLDVLDTVVASHGSHEAYVEGTLRVTYQQWAATSVGVAQMFADLGVTRGSIVALHLPSCTDYAVCYLAALRLGAIVTGINPRLGRAETSGILAQCSPAVTIVEDDAELPGAWPVLRRSRLKEAMAGDPGWRGVRPSRDDVVTIVWTSGTSGQPKGAVFDHQRLEATARSTGEMTSAFDRRLSPVPFAHVGYMTRLWDEIEHMVTNVIVPVPWTAGSALELIETERITVGQGVPTQWELMLRHPDVATRDCSSLRIIATGASRVPADLVERLQARFHCPVIVRYSTTEASVITSTSSTDTPEVVERSVGRAGAGIELRVVSDDGHPLGPDQLGMIEVRSEAVMLGYFGTEDSPITADGWLVTGDQGALLDDDRLRLVGRRSDMFVRGGYNIYPLEVEHALARHPAVAEAAVAGIPDEVLGSIGVAFVVITPGQRLAVEELRQWCRLELADYKAPDQVRFVTELPRNQMGKPDKAALLGSV